MLTDISGPMYTLVSETTVPSWGDWETLRAALWALPAFDAWFKEFQLIVQSGRREFYKVEGEYAGWSRPGVVIVREAYRALKWQIRPTVALLQRYGALLADCGVGRNPRILTDMSGEMFRAIIEIETDGLSEWEARRRGMFRQPEFQVWFVQLCNHVEAGQHEIYRVEV